MSYQPHPDAALPDADTNKILDDYLFALLVLMSCGGGLIEIA